MLKLCLVDCETTGLNSRDNGLIQVSGKIIINNTEEGSFNWHIKPFSTDIIEPKALEVNRTTLEMLDGYPEPGLVLKEMKDFFYQYVDHDNPQDLLVPVGYNVTFDISFLKSFFYKLNAINSYKNIFDYHHIDVMSLALSYIDVNGLGNKMTSFHQVDVAKVMGIEFNEDKLHDATEDISISYEIYKIICKTLNNE